MITIRPYGGIGNRIRSIDSILAIPNPNNIPITVIWERTSSLNCTFEKLFQLPPHVTIVEKEANFQNIIGKLLSTLKKAARKLEIYFPKGYAKYIFEEELQKLRDTNFDFKQLFEFNSVYIETQHRFYSSGKDFQNFVPVKSIQERVDEIARFFSAHTIGVHIRRTDNQKSIDYSPLHLFIESMNKAILEYPDTNFFLATDSLVEEKKLEEKFGEKILVQKNKRLDRNDPLAIQDALVDMLLLSKTKMILGSFWSSFSDTAAKIGKIDLVTIRL